VEALIFHRQRDHVEGEYRDELVRRRVVVVPSPPLATQAAHDEAEEQRHEELVAKFTIGEQPRAGLHRQVARGVLNSVPDLVPPR